MLKVKPGEKLRPEHLQSVLIARCGMNCGLCMGYLRAKKRCSGCRAGDEGQAPSVLACPIRRCEQVAADDFCSACAALPCPRLRRLDARYRTKYRMSMLANLQAIHATGVAAFVESERERWACPECGSVQCVHTAECIYCGHVWP